MRRHPATVLGFMIFVVVLSSCSSSSSAMNERGYEVGVGTVPGLGRVLVDARGMTLYVYEPDRQGLSQCKGICAVQWPPLLASGGTARLGPGVDAALIGSVERANGTVQVTYNRWPLYSYEQDGAPGQAIGQGDDMGLWYAISPNGNAIH